ncbi:MAG: hypothetical protein LBH43_03360, partial [Treponema sp.]|nr:hypothetical protein [Treponema sp.]
VLGWASAAFTNCDSNGVREETRPDKLSDPLPKVDFPELAGAAEWSQTKVDAEMLKVVTDVCNVGETLMWQYKNAETDKTDKKANRANKNIIAALEYLLSDCRQNNGKLLFRRSSYPSLNSINDTLTGSTNLIGATKGYSEYALRYAVWLDQHRHLPQEKRDSIQTDFQNILMGIVVQHGGPCITYDPTEAIPEIKKHFINQIGHGLHDNAVDMLEMLTRLDTWVEDLHILGFDLNLNMNNAGSVSAGMAGSK